MTTDTDAYEFEDHDMQLRVSHGDQTIILAMRDDQIALNVKDDDIRGNWPTEVQEAADKIGASRLEMLYEQARSDYWYGAGRSARQDGFGDVSSAGRSEGWLIVEGSVPYDLADLREMAAGDGEDDDFRQRFLRFVFERDADIDFYRSEFFTAVKAAANEPPAAPERIRVLAVTFDGEQVELYRNVPAVESAFGAAEATALVETCRKAVNGTRETHYTTMEGGEVRVEYLEVREAQ